MSKEQLKEELEHRGLSTAGNKVELLIRLREAMEQEGSVPENDKGDVKDQTIVAVGGATGGVAPTNNFDMGQLLAAMKQVIAEVFAEQITRQKQHTAEIIQLMKQNVGEMKQVLTQETANQKHEVLLTFF